MLIIASGIKVDDTYHLTYYNILDNYNSTWSSIITYRDSH